MGILATTLKSRQVRQAIGTVRKIKKSPLEVTKGDDGSILSKILNWEKRLGNLLVSDFISVFTGIFKSDFWSKALGWILGGIQFLWTFNWNISNEDLDKSLAEAKTALIAAAGDALGQSIGWILCGALPGTIMFKFNEALALHVLKNVGEEALEEISAAVGNLLRISFQYVLRSGFIYLFKAVRGIMFPGKDFKNAQPWSFATGWENFVDSFSGDKKVFVESTGEAIVESCIQALYVVANSVDNFLAANSLNNPKILGENKTIELEFSRSNDD